MNAGARMTDDEARRIARDRLLASLRLEDHDIGTRVAFIILAEGASENILETARIAHAATLAATNRTTGAGHFPAAKAGQAEHTKPSSRPAAELSRPKDPGNARPAGAAAPHGPGAKDGAAGTQPWRGRRIDHDRDARIVALRQAGLSWRAIMAETGAPISVVQRALTAAGLVTRQQAPSEHPSANPQAAAAQQPAGGGRTPPAGHDAPRADAPPRESVEDFLARGGTIKKLPGFDPSVDDASKPLVPWAENESRSPPKTASSRAERIRVQAQAIKSYQENTRS